MPQSPKSRKAHFLDALRRILEAAQVQGLSEKTVTAGELHSFVGGYPGENHRMPSCCSAMRQEKQADDAILYEPPQKAGASLKIRYRLPRKFWIEIYWPSRKGKRDLSQLYLWYQERYRHLIRNVLAGDRVAFYETQNLGGAMRLFATGTVTNDYEDVPPEEQERGGKTWTLVRKVKTGFKVSPEKGIPYASLLKILQVERISQKRFSIGQSKFVALEDMVRQLEFSGNATQNAEGFVPDKNSQAEKTEWRDFEPGSPKVFETGSSGSDPAAALARKERSFNNHEEIRALLAGRIRSAGMTPLFDRHVDLFCEGQAGQFLFEVKSATERNWLKQVRAGVSQLYEYRYRRALPNAILCLVMQSPPPQGLEWIADYLGKDRQINLAWPTGEGFMLPTKNTLLAFLMARQPAHRP